jgi:hypothetical protein
VGCGNAREPRLRTDSRGAGPFAVRAVQPRKGRSGAAVRGSPWWRQRTPGASVHCSRGEPGSNAHAGGIRPGRDTERPALSESGRPDPSLYRHLRVACAGRVSQRLARWDSSPTSARRARCPAAAAVAHDASSRARHPLGAERSCDVRSAFREEAPASVDHRRERGAPASGRNLEGEPSPGRIGPRRIGNGAVRSRTRRRSNASKPRAPV